MLNVFYLNGLLWLLLMVLGARTEMVDLQDCSQLMDTQKLVYCCGQSFLDKFIFAGSNCTSYWDDFGPCRYDCLYKYWNLLDENNQIKKPELYTMITELYSPLNGYNNYGTALKKAFGICETLGSKHTEFVMFYSSLSSNVSKCPTHAMLLDHCATVYLTLKCPKENFRGGVECSKLLRVVDACTAKMTDLETSAKNVD
ncbi:hypothetical protein KR009_006927, partial [Drosophila setifemur]